MTRLTARNILQRLAELDEQTLHLDPENAEDLDELHRIADLMWALEDLLDQAVELENCYN